MFYTLLFLVVICNNSFSQETYRFEGQVKGLQDSTCMLAYYYGDKQFAKDTAQIGFVTIFISIFVMLISPFIKKLMHGVH